MEIGLVLYLDQTAREWDPARIILQVVNFRISLQRIIHSGLLIKLESIEKLTNRCRCSHNMWLINENMGLNDDDYY